MRWVVLLGVAACGGEVDRARAIDAPAGTSARPAPVSEPYERTARNLEPEDLAVLQHADELTLLRLDPEVDDAEGFHGFKVVRRVIVSGEAKQPLIDDIAVAINGSDGSVAKCFDPHHGISAKKGAATVDLVICFECNQLYVYGKYPARVPISSATEAEIDALFVNVLARALR
jgi:hypothetical protein